MYAVQLYITEPDCQRIRGRQMEEQSLKLRLKAKWKRSLKMKKAIEMTLQSLRELSSIRLPPSLKSRTMVLDVMYRHSEYWSLIGIEDVSANIVIAPGMSCTRHLGQLPAKLRPEK